MASSILKCVKCGSYAITVSCSCGGERITPKPAKWSPEDKYGSYRRQYKELNKVSR